MEFARRKYLGDLASSIGNGMVKIVTGPRRSGKSYLLFNLFVGYLRSQGVADDHIVGLQLDKGENARYRDLDELSKYFSDRRAQDGKTQFFLIDEIQLAEPKDNPWAKGQKITFYDVLNDFLGYPNTEVFVTGSNSRLLSTDIATEFRGRGWQISMHPLSFSEIREATPNSVSDYSLWEAYYRYGGLPACVSEADEAKKRRYLSGVFEATYLRDIADRHGLRGETALRELTSFLASSVGSLVSPNKISNAFRSREGLSTAPATISRYISYLQDAFLISEAKRYDLKGKSFISGSSKCYFDDLGLRSAAAGFKGMDQEPHFMENAIYNELIARGYQVNVGAVISNEYIGGRQTKVSREVDFVVEDFGERYYIQSALYLPDEAKVMQEKASFKRIGDSFQKIIITKFTSGISNDPDGVVRMGLFDFFEDKEFFRRRIS